MIRGDLLKNFINILFVCLLFKYLNISLSLLFDHCRFAHTNVLWLRLMSTSCDLICYRWILRCPEGYSGSNCESKLSSCHDLLCFNGGTCIDQSVGYDCDCPIGKYEISNCIRNRCLKSLKSKFDAYSCGFGNRKENSSGFQRTTYFE